MKFSKNTEYAIRVMVLMARTPETRYSVRVLHTQLDLPNKYLGRLMPQLGQASLLHVKRGQHGGYQLARPSETINILEIITACEGTKGFERCILGLDTCSNEDPCALHIQMLPHRKALLDLWKNTSLKELASDGMTRLRNSLSEQT